jgi:ubiquinone/menaquinone biosynthesis C-methylase UbiE
MESFEQNRVSWNELTRMHVESEFYNVSGFKNGETSLNHIEIEALGDVKGKKILHLQCHFGLDTLSLARMGAEVVGVDISDASIEKARELATELDIKARFIRSNVYDIEKVLDEQFDIVYTSYGAINWLHDLDEWARLIKRFLKPGGMFYMVEFHPYSYSLNEKGEIAYPYFNTEPIESVVEKTYTDNSQVEKQDLKHIEWHHSISEVLNSLLGQGLTIQRFDEYPYQVYNCFPGMKEIEHGKWVYEKYGLLIPYMYAVKAIG